MRGSQKGATPLTAKSGNANMPSYDKQNGGRPLMPTLSASAKAGNRTPLTPRVAGSVAPRSSTPLSRQGQRAETPSTSSKDDLSTPVSAFLNNNITPRSGQRKSRVDSTNTTPTGTPNGTPTPHPIDSSRAIHDAPIHAPGLGISGTGDGVKRPTVSFNTNTHTPDPAYSRSPIASNPDSKFFFASDAKTAQTQRPTLQSKTSSTFFYANGESIPPPPQSSSGSAVGSSLGDERAHPKFFHANGTPDLQLSPSPHFAPPRPSSVVSSSSRSSPRISGSNNGTISPPARPMSPSKLNQHASVASLRNTPSLPSPVLPRPQPNGRGQSANNVIHSRKSSIDATPGRLSSHGRSASMGSSNGTTARKVSGGSSVELMPPSTPLNLITTGLVSTPEESTEAETKEEASSDILISPIKTGQTIEQLNELAANARRERKVLDLEITNSSLAAINRTLEREMRKQTAELRRYRRLSRSGRLSIAASSLRESTGTVSTIDGIVEGVTLSDMSEEEEEEEESDFSEDSESMDDGSLSPSAMAESDLRHRKRDEKRLQLDLSKHQQLLIDSQKMNQSLKRCLGWTEALISEGKKALEYQVRVSDVVGGRVLAPDELEDRQAEIDNEGMSDIGAQMLRDARAKAAAAAEAEKSSPPWGGEGRDDRDSGIDIEGSQKDALGSFGPLLH
ncbi:hypothetical protein B0J14DRAFT_483234 [Halenospora varia]|nr:hypothetical protein B0J14DRAFT_483234 [Halenospora varia]